MHAAIEHEPLPCGFEVITIGANLSAPGEIDEFQPGEDERFRLTRATANFYRHPERSRGTPWRPRSTCGRGPSTSLGMTADSKQLLENPHPVSEQDFLNLFVIKSALDQFAGDISRVRMIR